MFLVMALHNIIDFPSYIWDRTKLFCFPNMRVFQLDVRCPLRDDCKENIRVMYIANKSELDLDFLFDCLFNSVRDHLRKKHKVNAPFCELQWTNHGQKFTLTSKALNMGDFYKEDYNK